MTDRAAWSDRLEGWLDDRSAVLTLPAPTSELDVTQRLNQKGLHGCCVYLSGVSDKAGLMEAFRRDLDWPDWFGANWDAMADLLAGPEDPAARLFVLLLIDFNGLRNNAPAVSATLLELIEELSADPHSLLVGAILLDASSQDGVAGGSGV